jgi:DNA-binding response OmpR family regulator
MVPTVLVVDDEKFIVELIADILAEEGYDVACARDGFEAEQVIDRNPPDLVIADMMMPHVDGVELIKHIRQRPERIRVLLLSAVRKPGNLDVPFLPKPFDVDELVATVGMLTQRSGHPQPTA